MPKKPPVNLDKTFTWGTLPIGSSRIAIRHLVLWFGLLLWLVPTMIGTGVHGIAWLAFNLTFLIVLIFLGFPCRSISLNKIATCFCGGGLTMGMTIAVGIPLLNIIGVSSPLKPFFTVPFEELMKLLPLVFFLIRGRKFSTWTLGAVDCLLMGAASGAGFAFVEDAYSHAASHSALNNLSVWLPSAEIINGRIISGHAIWTGLAAGVLGLVWAHKGKQIWWYPLALLGIACAIFDHLAINYNTTQGAVTWGQNVFNFFAANGYVTLAFFGLVFVLSTLGDMFIQKVALPKTKEFNPPTSKERKDRKESLEFYWDYLLDRRKLSYAYWHLKARVNNCSPSLALTVAILAKRLINRYASAEPIKVTVHGSQQQDGIRLDLPEFGSTITINAKDRAKTIELNKESVDSKAVTESGKFSSPGTPDAQVKNDPFQLGLPDRYEIIDEVSEGGMGLIYKARHRNTQAYLAIKVMHFQMARNPVLLKRFEMEAQMASSLQHPNIVTVHDFGVSTKSVPYLVMEWLDGSNLEPVIKAGGPLSLVRFLHIFRQAASALAYAHKCGIVHRDIKPSNLILTYRGNEPDFLKIVDFGIAKLLEDEATMNLTKTGDVMGSPLFMSPEQCLGERADRRSDIYSLGCVMYEAIVGQPPHKAENAVQMIYKHVHEMPRRPRDLNANIEQVDLIERLLFKLLQKDPNNRPSSMEEVEQMLIGLQGRLGLGEQPS